MNAPDDRLLPAEPGVRRIARELYESVAQAPLVCPHTHVDARLFADDGFGGLSPTELLLTSNHYLFRMLYSQGIPLERLGIRPKGEPLSEADARAAWQTFAESYYVFRGTPSDIWLRHELASVFGVQERLDGDSAMRIYDRIAARLASPDFRPRALFGRFNIEALCTTDASTDTLEHHQAIRDSGWPGRVLPTFRPDAVINLDTPDWLRHVEALAAASGIAVDGYRSFIRALRDRRAHFQRLGAVATDHGALTAHTEELSAQEAVSLFERALRGRATADDAARFTAHMLIEMAGMSAEDGLVMQLHVGSSRNHNTPLSERFGPDIGADIPIRADFTNGLRALLNKHGNDPRLALVVFTLDESAYSRELAPLAGHYPALKLGAPWWFHDSPNGMTRYLERVVETAGIYNTAGFNDDARDFLSIPARHDMARRVNAGWLAGLVARGIVGMDDALDMAQEMAHRLARRTYRLDVGESEARGNAG